MLESLDFRRIFLFVFWAVIFVRGFYIGGYRTYPVFYAYASTAFLWTAVCFVVIGVWGIDDQRYLVVYYIGKVIFQVAAGIFLVWLLWLPRKGLRLRTEMPVWGFFLLLSFLVETFLSSGSYMGWRVTRGGAFFLLLVATQTIFRCLPPAGFRLGRNMGVALAGTSLMLLLDFLNSSLYLSQLWPYTSFGDLADLTGVASWGAIAWGMFELDKPKWGQ